MDGGVRRRPLRPLYRTTRCRRRFRRQRLAGNLVSGFRPFHRRVGRPPIGPSCRGKCGFDEPDVLSQVDLPKQRRAQTARPVEPDSRTWFPAWRDEAATGTRRPVVHVERGATHALSVRGATSLALSGGSDARSYADSAVPPGHRWFPWTRGCVSNANGMNAERRRTPRPPAAGTARNLWSLRPCRAAAARPADTGGTGARRSSAPSGSTWTPSPGGSAPTAARIRPATSRGACSRARWGCRGWWSCSGASASAPTWFIPGHSVETFPDQCRHGGRTPATKSGCTATRTKTPSP